MSVSLAGVILKISIGIGDRPGDLGNLSRALPCCALENFHRLAQELLPLPMPMVGEEEKSLELRVRNILADGREVKAQDWAELSDKSIKLGCKLWTWLQCLVISFLYCNSVPGRMLSEGMLHPPQGSPA